MQGQFGATATLGSYQAIMDFCAAPKQVVFNGESASATDFQSARYILAAALMDDGYCFVSNDNSYRVDDSICNPMGNGSQTITASQINTYLGGSYSFSYISGVQDTTTNPGGPFSQATLADSDGLLLLKSSSSSVTLQGSWDSGYTSTGVTQKS